MERIITIPCPICKGDIHVELHSLLKGCTFSCPQCGGVLSMDVSSRGTVENAVEKYEQLMEKSKNVSDSIANPE